MKGRPNTILAHCAIHRDRKSKNENLSDNMEYCIHNVCVQCAFNEKYSHQHSTEYIVCVSHRNWFELKTHSEMCIFYTHDLITLYVFHWPWQCIFICNM